MKVLIFLQLSYMGAYNNFYQWTLGATRFQKWLSEIYFHFSNTIKIVHCPYLYKILNEVTLNLQLMTWYLCKMSISRLVSDQEVSWKIWTLCWFFNEVLLIFIQNINTKATSDQEVSWKLKIIGLFANTVYNCESSLDLKTEIGGLLF